MQAIREMKDFGEYIASGTKKTAPDYLEDRFYERLEFLCGGNRKIKNNTGEWPNQIEGKEILRDILNSNLFVVKTQDDSILQGREKFNEIVKELLEMKNQDQDVFPQDFIEIKNKILNKINSSIPKTD